MADARTAASDSVAAGNAHASSAAMHGAMPFGPRIEATAETFAAAIEQARALGTGEIVGALSHPALGAIDAPLGDKRMGLLHIERKHPEVPLAELPDIIARSEVISRTEARAELFDGITRSSIRLRYEESYGGPSFEKHWLVTAWEKDRPGAVTGRAPDRAETGSSPRPASENLRPGEPDIKAGVPLMRDDGTVEIISRDALGRVAEREKWMGDVIAACKN